MVSTARVRRQEVVVDVNVVLAALVVVVPLLLVVLLILRVRSPCRILGCAAAAVAEDIGLDLDDGIRGGDGGDELILILVLVDFSREVAPARPAAAAVDGR